MPLDFESIALDNWPFSLTGICYGAGTRLQLEVLYSEHNIRPSATQMRSAWQKRQQGRGVPLLVVVLHNELAYMCGPSGEDPTVLEELDPGQVERICEEALEQTSRPATLRALRDSLGALAEDGLPGLRNEGFLAAHELSSGVPNRGDWQSAGDSARNILSQTGRDLLTSLGYTIDTLDNVTDVLRKGEHKNAIAILLDESETPESGSPRIPGSISPVSYALARADEENLDWVILLHGRKIRIYPVKLDIGVGRRGRTETFVECHTGLIPDDQAAYLWLLFSADALAKDGTLGAIINDSKDFAGDLANQLRERIYDFVVPGLAEGIAKARGTENPTAQELSETYHMAMLVLFRVLFIAYGEDKDLLPYRYNGLYAKRSLKAKAKELLTLNDTEDAFGENDGWWQEIKNIFRAIDKGYKSWGVPAYNGGLFSSNPDDSGVGAALEEVSLPDSVFGPVLQNLLLVPTAEGCLGPVDFRSLGVREFGTIYEGLLESELSVAESDLTIEKTGKNKDSYRPCVGDEEPTIPLGSVYLHNASGARKTTGSYYTKQFAVEHLLDTALEPALTAHFERLNQQEDLEASESFFDFRIADIASGSAHFLVAAVDRIEAAMSKYLANRDLPEVRLELDRQRKEAIKALGDAADFYPDLEDNALLRRLIARRCIYGVDMNEVAVQLARLGLWIHTFVPGLPLSLLDRNIAHGNSLIGIGQLSEFEDRLREEFGDSDEGTQTTSFFELTTRHFVGDAEEALRRLGRLADTTQAEIREARRAWAEADDAIKPARALCDILTAARIEGVPFPFDFTHWEEERNSIFGSRVHLHALKVLGDMNVLHFPTAFPEVFLRDRPGFDVILGNPPWDEVRVEEKEFWARHYPGLRGLKQRERRARTDELIEERPDLLRAFNREIKAADFLRKALSAGPFPGMGTSDADLYKAFCWRFWNLTGSNQSRIGVVMPRSVVAAKGSEEFRRKVFDNSKAVDVVSLLNNKRWAFDIHAQYTIVLLTVSKMESAVPIVTLSGPFCSLDEFNGRDEIPAAQFCGADIRAWNDSASLPLISSPESIFVFSQLRESPDLYTGEPNRSLFRPYSELHSGSGRVYMDQVSEECPDTFWPVYKGESFDLWEPDTGSYYAWADPGVLVEVLQDKRVNGRTRRNSAFYECNKHWCTDIATLPCNHPRLVFRDVTNRTNRRTVVCALVPPNVFLADTAPYFLRKSGNTKDEAYLLGVTSSLVLDWYARKFVESHVKLYMINQFPYPNPTADSQLRKRTIKLAGRLACPDERFSNWASEVGVECGPLDEESKQDMIHELDAVVAHLYGLTDEHLTHIFETFHEGWEYQERLDSTLVHYNNWAEQL